MMMTAGYFRQIPDLPKFFWRYPISYINYGAWGLQVTSVRALPFSKYVQKERESNLHDGQMVYQMTTNKSFISQHANKLKYGTQCNF